jgi:tetratricopeptide (TPR) repeat protein
MRRALMIAAITFCASGCAATLSEDKVRDYSEDGLYLFQRGKYRDARESFEAALALRPEDPGLLYNIGECHDRLGNAPKAEQCYRQCLQQSPNLAECRHALVVLLVRSGRQPEAVQVVHAWLASEPKLAAAYVEDGWLYHQGGDLPKAQGRLQQALDLEPHNVRALTEMGLVYEAMQRPDRALTLYERALEGDPKQLEITDRVNYLLTKGAGRPHPE